MRTYKEHLEELALMEGRNAKIRAARKQEREQQQAKQTARRERSQMSAQKSKEARDRRPSKAEQDFQSRELNNELKRRRVQRDDERVAKIKQADARRVAKDAVDDRASGVGGGVKKALGGDLIQRARKGDSPETAEEIKKRRRKAQADAAAGAVKGAGRAAGRVAGSALNAMGKGPGEDKRGPAQSQDQQGSQEIKRGQRG